MSGVPSQRYLIDLLKQLGVAALYAALLYIGENHFKNSTPVGYFEPASGLVLAALLIGGKRYVWSILLGAFLAHATTDDSLWEVIAVASGDTLQALCGAWLLTRDDRFDLRLQSLRDYLQLILLGGAASIAAGALTANTILLVSGLLAPANYFHSVIQWWMSDTLGVILVAPLILAWLGIRKDWRTAWMMAEAALILGLAILACQAIFLGWWPDNIGIEAKGYWMFLIITWVAVRIGACGTTVVLTMTAIYALLGAIHGVGYFAHDIAKTHLVNYWLYTMTMSVVGMALATHFTERRQLEQQLSRRLRHRDVMDHISRISLSSVNIEELLGRVLDKMLTVFNADRAYFLYPCDPGAPSWSVPIERTRPAWPGAFASGMVIPMTHEVAEVFREVLATTKPLPYGHAASRCIPAAVAEQFSIRSMIQMALRPRVDNPWVMGLHHCAQEQAYDEDDLLIFRDIGRRVADALSSMIMLKNLHESEANLRAILDNMQDLFYRTDQDGRIIMVSASVKAVLGYEQEDVIGRQVADLYAAPEARATFLKKLEENEGVIHGYEVALLHKDGHLVWVSTNSHSYLDKNGTVAGVEGVGHDITERKQAEEQIRTLAFYDALTQLPNRRLLNDRLEQTIAASKRSAHYGALMFLDLDNFKPLNDTYGHDVGDLLLVEVAQRLTRCVREADTVARFGGDEFVVVLGELDPGKGESARQAGIVAEKICAALAEPYALKHQREGSAETTIEHRCTSSIGVTLFVNHETSAEEILKYADMAMYQAKETGRNRIHFSPCKANEFASTDDFFHRSSCLKIFKRPPDGGCPLNNHPEKT